MLRATVRGVLARKFRLALTSLAVVLGVSFVSTTYVLTDTLDRSFRSVFDQTLSGVDVVLRSRPLPGDDDHERFSDSVLRQVRSIDAVASAGGFIEGYAQFVGKDGDAIGGDATPSFGVAWIGGRERGPLRLLDVDGRRSRAPRAANEVAMDVDKVPGDAPVLGAHGWRIVDPRPLSADPWRYRDYIRSSRGEFTVAKDINIRLRSGWFSDRAACYLAAGSLLWWPVFQDAPQRLSNASKVLYLFLAFLLASPVGLLLALAPEPAYDYYVDGGGLWGLGVHTDQQIAGVTMAVEQSIVFFAVFAVYFFRFLGDEERASAPHAE